MTTNTWIASPNKYLTNKNPCFTIYDVLPKWIANEYLLIKSFFMQELIGWMIHSFMYYVLLIFKIMLPFILKSIGTFKKMPHVSNCEKFYVLRDIFKCLIYFKRFQQHLTSYRNRVKKAFDTKLSYTEYKNWICNLSWASADSCLETIFPKCIS